MLLHSAVLLALRWVEAPTETAPVAELPPIEIVEAPPVVQEAPSPPDTANRAAQNLVDQGSARPDLPLSAEMTRRGPDRPASQPTPAASDHQETVSQPAPLVPTEPSPQPRPVLPLSPPPEPLAQETPAPQPTPSPVVRQQPAVAPEPVARPAVTPAPTPPVAPTSDPRRVARASEPASPASSPRPAPPPKGNAGLLGGPIHRGGSQAWFDQEANSTRNAPGPTQLAARQDVDLGPYLANLRRRVQQNWRPRTPDRQRQTVVGFTIDRSGQIGNLRVLRSSGSPQTDAETLEAIQRAAPFGPLPENFAYNQLEIEFTFNIYVNNVVIQQPRSWYGF